MVDNMVKKETFSDKVLEFYDELSKTIITLPNNYHTNNPFNSLNKYKVKEMTELFYKKYYNDSHKRYLILGSSPARKGTAVTGIPFEDANHLYKITGVKIDNFYINKSSSNFLYKVMEQYGGCEKFYKEFFMSFVCPIGIVNVNSKGNEVNSNYYENKKLESTLYDFIVASLKKQISFGVDTSICYCIGSGENYIFLKKLNEKYHFFGKIIPLEHPRFIMQYNRKDEDKYLNKYITALNSCKKNDNEKEG